MLNFGPSIRYNSTLAKSTKNFSGLNVFQCMFVQKKLKVEDKTFVQTYAHHLYLHGNYTWNPANIKYQYDVALTLKGILSDIHQTSAYLILHFNSGSLTQVYDTLQLAETPLQHLCMENMVGAGKQCGATQEDIRKFAEFFDTNLPSFCFDTQHAYASGWSEYSDLQALEFYNDYHLKLQLIHLNDSEVLFGSKKDRHGKVALGEGYIWANHLERLYDLVVYSAENNIDCIDEGRDYFRSRNFIEDIIKNHS